MAATRSVDPESVPPMVGLVASKRWRQIRQQIRGRSAMSRRSYVLRHDFATVPLAAAFWEDHPAAQNGTVVVLPEEPLADPLAADPPTADQTADPLTAEPPADPNPDPPPDPPADPPADPLAEANPPSPSLPGYVVVWSSAEEQAKAKRRRLERARVQAHRRSGSASD